MAEDEPRTDAAEDELERDADAGNPWAKTSSGDADDVVDEDA
jgi:hypothetical protein